MNNNQKDLKDQRTDLKDQKSEQKNERTGGNNTTPDRTMPNARNGSEKESGSQRKEAGPGRAMEDRSDRSKSTDKSTQGPDKRS